MEKRLLVAAAISLAFLLLWERLAPRPPAPRPGAARPTASAPAPSPVEPVVPASSVAPAEGQPSAEQVAGEAEERVVVDRPLYRATFSNRGAVLSSFVLKTYNDDQGNQLEMVHQGLPGRPFHLRFDGDEPAEKAANESLYRVERTESPDAGTVVFRFAGNGRSFRKTFRFDGGHLFSAEIAESGPRAACWVEIGPGLRNLSDTERENRFTGGSGGAIYDGEKARSVTRERGAKGLSETLPRGGWIGLEDNYFLAAALPSVSAPARIRASAAEKGAELEAGLQVPGHLAMTVYCGPKKLDELTALNLHLEESIRFTAFGLNLGWIAKPLLWLMKFSYRHVVPNWGVAILIVTLLVRLALFPLTHKSYVGMKKMQKLQPRINAVKNRYKGVKMDAEQRKKMNEEMMAVYAAEGASPVGGCLPLIAQMPVFIAFYGLLERSVELRHAPFILWIHDLSAKDSTYILVILMTATMFLQQAMTPSTADPAQKRMFLIMPLFMGFVMKEMPAGLVLYMVFSNLLTIGQQVLINRLLAEEPKPTPPRGQAKKKAEARVG
jgi:YidC/Oxa1 family membrane protein insertase